MTKEKESLIDSIEFKINLMIQQENYYLIVNGQKVWCYIHEGKLMWHQTLEEVIKEVQDDCVFNGHEEVYPITDEPCPECEEDKIKITQMFDKGEL